MLKFERSKYRKKERKKARKKERKRERKVSLCINRSTDEHKRYVLFKSGDLKMLVSFLISPQYHFIQMKNICS